LTGVHDAGVTIENIRRYQQAIDDGILKIRVYAMLFCKEGNLYCADGVEKISHPLLKLRSVKLFADGALGSFGAALKAPYSDAIDQSGTLIDTPDVFNRVIGEYARSGWQVNTHAIGDRANKVVLDAYEMVCE
jgi:predicted amidohydrolase YtcJ